MASGVYTHPYTHTHTHTHTLADKSDYKKPGAPACGRRTWFNDFGFRTGTVFKRLWFYWNYNSKWKPEQH